MKKYKKQDIETRFLRHVDKTSSSKGCWIWTGSLRNGYGLCNVRGKMLSAHRVSFELYKGKIPKDQLVLHSCDNRRCVNPNHLSLGSFQDNSTDMVNKNRQAKGVINGSSKLTEAQVLEIRNKYIPRKYSTRKLAKEYNVSQYCINCIVNRKTWKHI